MHFVTDLLWLFRSFYLRRSSIERFVERYLIGEWPTTQWAKEKDQKDKQSSTNNHLQINTQFYKDWKLWTPLKTQVFLQGLSVPAPLVTPIVLTAKSH
jgi:hypothetical protein